MAHGKVKVNLIARNDIREIMIETALMYCNFNWSETKGIIRSTFIYSGDEEAVRQAESQIRSWYLSIVE